GWGVVGGLQLWGGGVSSVRRTSARRGLRDPPAGARWLLWLWNRVPQARGKPPAGSLLAKIPSDGPGNDLARLAADCIREFYPEPGSGRQTSHAARKRAQAGQAFAKKVASASSGFIEQGA